jgi:hypothetical protein
MVQKFSYRKISVTDSLSFISGDGIKYPSAWHLVGCSDDGCGVTAEYVARHYTRKGICLIMKLCALSESQFQSRRIYSFGHLAELALSPGRFLKTSELKNLEDNQ